MGIPSRTFQVSLYPPALALQLSPMQVGPVPEVEDISQLDHPQLAMLHLTVRKNVTPPVSPRATTPVVDNMRSPRPPLPSGSFFKEPPTTEIATTLPHSGEPNGPDEESSPIKPRAQRIAAAPAAEPLPLLLPSPDRNPLFPTMGERPRSSHSRLRPAHAWQTVANHDSKRNRDSKKTEVRSGLAGRSAVRLAPMPAGSGIAITATVVVTVPKGSSSAAHPVSPQVSNGPLFRVGRLVPIQLGSSVRNGFRPVISTNGASSTQAPKLGGVPSLPLEASPAPSPDFSTRPDLSPSPDTVIAIRLPAPSPDSSQARADNRSSAGPADTAQKCDSCRSCCSKFWSCLSYYFCCKWLC